jgi:hypothetical protein
MEYTFLIPLIYHPDLVEQIKYGYDHLKSVTYGMMERPPELSRRATRSHPPAHPRHCLTCCARVFVSDCRCRPPRRLIPNVFGLWQTTRYKHLRALLPMTTAAATIGLRGRIMLSPPSSLYKKQHCIGNRWPPSRTRETALHR